MLKTLMLIGSDSIPEFVVGSSFDTTSFTVGIIIGIFAGLAIMGIVKYIKFIIKDNKEMQEKINSQKSDE